MTWEEYKRIQAEAAARGEFVLIDTVITDLPPGRPRGSPSCSRGCCQARTRYPNRD